jgi:hypothetical protein
MAMPDVGMQGHHDAVLVDRQLLGQPHHQRRILSEQ